MFQRKDKTMKKGKINVVDIVVVVVLLVVVAIAAYKFGVVNRIQSTGITNEESMTDYTGVIKGVRQPTVDAFHIGDKMYDDKTGNYMGDIVDIQVAPQKVLELSPQGEYVEVEKLDYFNITLTLRGPVLEKDKGYFVSGSMELKTNSEFPVYTKYAKPNIQITGIGPSKAEEK